MTTTLASIDGNTTVVDEPSPAQVFKSRRSAFAAKLLHFYRNRGSGLSQMTRSNFLDGLMGMALAHTQRRVQRMNKRDAAEALFLMGVALERISQAKSEEEFLGLFHIEWRASWDS